MSDSQTYSIPLVSKKEIAKDTFTFTFKRPKGFEFVPGQYNRWSLPITASDGRGSSRFFTISSSPLDKKILSITTKLMQSDFKKALLNLNENDEIKIFGPMGNFTIDEDDPRPKVFIAGGIGITPAHSLFSYAATRNLSIPLTLIASFSTTNELVFYQELTNLQSSHTNIKVIYTITKPQDSQKNWTGETGRISEEMIKKYVPDIPNSIFYVIGPPPMVDDAKTLLHEMHLPEIQFRTEAFTGY